MRNYNVYLETPKGANGGGGGLGRLMYGETEGERGKERSRSETRGEPRSVRSKGGERRFVEGGGGGKFSSG